MTEAEAKAWFARRFDPAAIERVERFLMLVTEENTHQNLVAPSTIEAMWSRHAVDSAQLLAWDRSGKWMDVGTGGGFPGMIVGLLRSDPVLLVEPRRKRAEFLRSCADRLQATNIAVACSRAEQVMSTFNVISARAVATVEKLLRMAAHCATNDTRWVLPRGRHLDAESRSLARERFKMFHVEHSVSDPSSAILVLEGLRAS